VFFEKLIEQTADEDRVEVSNELIIFFKKLHSTFDEHAALLKK
jgi:hypothetical protein